MSSTFATGPPPAKPRSGGLAGKGCATLFFLVFLGMGGTFAFLIGRGFVNSVRSYSWKETPCRIVESSVAQDGTKWVFHVRYRYEGERESRTYRFGYAGSDQISDARRLADKYPAGAAAVCFVDPAAPDRSCLERAPLSAGFAILLPLVFVAVGAGGIFFVWRWRPRGGFGGDRPAALSDGATSPKKAAGCMAAFFAVFLLAGSGFLLFFIRPVISNIASRSWNEVPCVIISSAVGRHSGGKSTTFSVDILYEYQVSGRAYRSNRYQFLGGSSSGYGGKEEVVNRNPPGARNVCYVNPADPNDAVFTRAFTPIYLFVLIPLVFVAVGAGGIIHAIKTARAKSSPGGSIGWTGSGAPPGTGGSARVGRSGEGFSFAKSGPRSPAGPVKLKTGSPFGRLLGMIFIALFWNGIVSVFFLEMLRGWNSGGKPIVLTLFLVPFVVIGVALIGGIFYSFLALFNPRVRATLSTPEIPVGGSASIEWEFSGSASRITRLTIVLEGREEATYRRGTSSTTDKSTFSTISVFDSAAGGGAIRSGTSRFSVPAGSMHSVSATHNKIVWTLKLTGEIPRWPDVSEQFDLAVTPGHPVGSLRVGDA